MEAGGSTIAVHRGLMLDELVTPHGGTLLQLTTTDVRGDIEEVRGRGGDIVLEPTATDWGTTTAYIRGPHGLLVELSTPA